MIEADVVTHFATWLSRAGSSVETELNFADVVAQRDGVRMVVEAKGTTTSPGLDVDTAYGQLLRRLDPNRSDQIYALVVPESARAAAERVRQEVRVLLKIEVMVVAEDGTVERA